MRKTAIIFPGIGYHTDKPLLYYGKKLAKELGYQLIEVPYTGFEAGIFGNPQKMERAFAHAMAQGDEILSAYHFSAEDDILIISKSIGTAVAGAWQKKEGILARNLYFTPVAATFDQVRPDSGIVFHGTNDPWVESRIVTENCERLHLPLVVIEGTNHSMEMGDTLTDLANMQDMMRQCREYLVAV